jgi:hypothetical protein
MEPLIADGGSLAVFPVHANNPASSLAVPDIQAKDDTPPPVPPGTAQVVHTNVQVNGVAPSCFPPVPPWSEGVIPLSAQVHDVGHPLISFPPKTDDEDVMHASGHYDSAAAWPAVNPSHSADDNHVCQPPAVPVSPC